MSSCERGFAERWRSAVIELRLAVEHVQSTADELPMDIALVNDRHVHPCPLNLLYCHLGAFSDDTTALNCVQALLAEYGGGA